MFSCCLMRAFERPHTRGLGDVYSPKIAIRFPWRSISLSIFVAFGCKEAEENSLLVVCAFPTF